MALITATKENFEELLQADGTVVEFWAPWCGYCKRLAPVLKQIAQEYPDVPIVQVNIDDLEEISDQYEIETIPSMLVFHDKKPSETLVAPQAKAEIITWLKDHNARNLV